MKDHPQSDEPAPGPDNSSQRFRRLLRAADATQPPPANPQPEGETDEASPGPIDTSVARAEAPTQAFNLNEPLQIPAPAFK